MSENNFNLDEMNLEQKILKAKEVQRKFLALDVESVVILKELQKRLQENLDLLIDAYQLDKEGIDQEETIQEREREEEIFLKKLNRQFEVEEMIPAEVFRNEFGKVSHLSVPYGVLGVISNCEIFSILRLIILAILTRNGLVIRVNQNPGTNFLWIQNVKAILRKYQIEDLIALYATQEKVEKLEETEIIDGLIYIGKKVNVERLKLSTNKPIIYSGCGNYEVYVEDDLNHELIQKLQMNSNVKIYSKAGIGIGQEVKNLEEAILRIQETGNEYAVGIFTESRENAKIFVEQIKAKNIFVNASPTLVEDLEIKKEDLLYQKSILFFE